MKKPQRKVGRPCTISLNVDRDQLHIASGRIIQIIKTKVRGFSKSGGYIPLSQDYVGNESFVIVMRKR